MILGTVVFYGVFILGWLFLALAVVWTIALIVDQETWSVLAWLRIAFCVLMALLFLLRSGFFGKPWPGF